MEEKGVARKKLAGCEKVENQFIKIKTRLIFFLQNKKKIVICLVIKVNIFATTELFFWVTRYSPE